ncbi:hypothetical protein [Arthrobacter sp. 135MFCol5.1]|uniref:hypothetical protein n=1 Tax=Arthrobacter sp. 135MFCol5.1 TaxID=1158050 RepID=UPI0003AAD499|nr:hypothetical protein [Arthrobacter sp. 135MFCol5.1]
MALLIRGDVSGPMNSRTSRRRRPGYADYALALLSTVTAALILFDIGGETFAGAKLLACLVLPGWALVRWLPSVDPAARLVFTVVAGATAFALTAAAMGWLQLWNPRPAAVGIMLAAAVALLVPGPERIRAASSPLPRPQPGTYAPWLVLVAAMGMWVASLAATNPRLGDLGLLTAFPVTWYAALALVVALCIWSISRQRLHSGWLAGASLTGLVVMLYSSAGLLTAVPRLPWTYKHIAVTDLIQTTGHFDPSIDIYNRWPGFFLFSAFLGESSGYQDPMAYAGWAEPVFALMSVALVLAIARALTRNPRIYWTAALVFTLTNWLNQNYYSPQAFAYTLHLTMCLVILTFLRGTPAGWVLKLERRVAARFSKSGAKVEEPPTYSGRQQALAIVAVLVLQAMIVMSHQLTPYLAILGLFPLFLTRYFKPAWVAPALLLMALLYLLPNVDFVAGKYGLLSGFDFFANAGYKASNGSPGPSLLSGRWLAREALALSLFTALLAGLGFIRNIRLGNIRTTLIVGTLAATPILGLFGTSYGGEGRLRVFMFALPWLAIGAAWFLWAGKVPTRRTVVGAASAVTVLAVMFTAVYFQNEANVRVPAADVSASRWLDSNVRKGDAVVETNYHLPLLIGPHYSFYLRTGQLVSVASKLHSSTQPFTGDDMVAYVDKTRAGANLRASDRLFVVVSDLQQRTSTGVLRQFSKDAMVPLEHDLDVSKAAQVVFENKSVRIYEVSRADWGN